MKRFLSLLVVFSAPLLAQPPPYNPFPNQTKMDQGVTGSDFSAANAQAIYWINLIDQHQYEATWGEASMLVHDVTTRNQWAAAMDATRSRLGQVSSRKVASHQSLASLPSGLRGKFMVIKYDTQYSRAANRVETIVLTAEGRLGLWKVVSYNISGR